MQKRLTVHPDVQILRAGHDRKAISTLLNSGRKHRETDCHSIHCLLQSGRTNCIFQMSFQSKDIGVPFVMYRQMNKRRVVDGMLRRRTGLTCSFMLQEEAPFWRVIHSVCLQNIREGTLGMASAWLRLSTSLTNSEQKYWFSR